MIKVNEIAFTAYPVTDKERARDFYEGVLGLKVTMNSEAPEGFWIEYDIGPGTLAISNYWKPPTEAHMGAATGLEVEDYDATLASLKEKGVAFSMETMDTPVCRFCVVLDPDGNSIFIHKHKPKTA